MVNDCQKVRCAVPSNYQWCCAMHHFFHIWQSQPLKAYKYKDGDVQRWRPSQAFIDLIPLLPKAAKPRAVALVEFRV